jgi:hypothetical protein
MKHLFNVIKTNWLIALIFVLALVLRLVYLRDTITVGVDSVDQMNFAKEIFSRHGYLWHGPQLRSIICNGRDIVAFLGPFYIYLWAMPAALSHWNFLLPTAWQGILGACSIIAYYYLAQTLTNSKVAAKITAILLTFSFALVIADRTLWNPNFLPFFVALTLISFIKMIKGRGIYLIPFILTFSFATQIHASFWLFIPALIILWFVYRIKINKAILWLYALLVFVVSYLPMVVHEVIRKGDNLRNLYELLFKIKDCSPDPLTISDSIHRTIDRFSSSFWTTISGRMYEAPWKMWQNAILEEKFIMYTGIVFAIVWIIAFILQFTNKKPLTKREDFIIVPLTISAVYIAMTVFYSNALYDYYFMTVIPFVFITFAYLFAKIWPNILGKTIVIILISTFIIVNVNSYVTYVEARLNRDQAKNFMNPDLLWLDKVDMIRFIKEDAANEPISTRYYIDVPIANRVFQYLFDQQGVDTSGSDKYEYLIIEPKNRNIGHELDDEKVLFEKTFNTLRLIKISK